MMDITELNEQEKSAMLAKLCGWKISYIGNHNEKLLVATGAGVAGFDNYQDGNLYDPANMALAAQVIAHAYNNDLILQDIKNACFIFVTVSPELPLDLVLQNAVAAGMVG